MDRVAAGDFNKYEFIYACEQCTHFCPESESCTIGYPSHQHRKEIQLQRFELTGHMAFCRFIEID